MNIDECCEDGLIFEVYSNMSHKLPIINKMIFPITYSEEMVRELLSSDPYCMAIDDVIEIGYSIRLKPEFL